MGCNEIELLLTLKETLLTISRISCSSTFFLAAMAASSSSASDLSSAATLPHSSQQKDAERLIRDGKLIVVLFTVQTD